MPKNHKLDRKRVDWGVVGVCSGLILFLIGLCAQSLRQAQHALLLQKAVEAGNFVKANALLDQGGLGKDYIQDAFFAGAVRSKTSANYDFTRLFLEHHADPNTHKWGMPVLAFIIQGGNAKSARLLLDYGAKPNGGAFGRSLIQEAAISNNTEIVRALLEHGADFNAKDKMGRSLLYACILNKDTRCAKALLDRGVDPNQPDRIGPNQIARTDMLLSSAIYEKATGVARELILHGADVNTPNGVHMTPLGLARQRVDKSLIELLKARGAKE